MGLLLMEEKNGSDFVYFYETGICNPVLRKVILPYPGLMGHSLSDGGLIYDKAENLQDTLYC